MRIDDTNFGWIDPECKEFEDTVFDDIGICGCGDPDSVLDMLEEYLEKKSDYMSFKDQIAFAEKYHEELMLFMMYIMDNKGFTDHGSSVYGSWLTDKGKHFLELLKKEKNNENIYKCTNER